MAASAASLLACLGLVAAAAASKSGPGSAVAGKTLTVGLAEDPDALDPTLARTFVGRMVFLSMCEKLYDVNKSLQIVPQLAARMPKVSSDGKTMTIRLRAGIKFNDGTPLNAQAVKISIDRHRTLARSARASELTPVSSVAGFVTFETVSPFAPLTSLLADRAGMVMSPTQLSKLGNNFASNPVCVGPFQFVSRTAGDRIVLKKSNVYYNKSKVKLGGIVYRIIDEPNTMAVNLRSHGIDVGDRLASTSLSSIRHDTSLRLIRAVTIGYQGLTLNIGNKTGLRHPYQNVGTPLAKHSALRKAFELSLDRNTINRVVFNNLNVPDCSPISPALKAWRDPTFKCPKHNLALAKRLVKASGEKTPISVNLMLGTDSVNAKLGAVIQSEAGKAGFKVNLQPTEFTTSLNRADAGQFDMFAVGFSGRVDPDGTTYGFIHTGGSLNDSGYSNKTVDRLMDGARASRKVPARKAAYYKAFKIVQKDRPLIYLWHPINYTGVSKKISGVQVFGDGLIRVAFASK